MLAALGGRFADASATVDGLLAEAEAYGTTDLLDSALALHVLITRDLGRLDEAVGLLEFAVARWPTIDAYRAGLASTSAMAGDTDHGGRI